MQLVLKNSLWSLLLYSRSLLLYSRSLLLYSRSVLLVCRSLLLVSRSLFAGVSGLFCRRVSSLLTLGSLFFFFATVAGMGAW